MADCFRALPSSHIVLFAAIIKDNKTEPDLAFASLSYLHVIMKGGRFSKANLPCLPAGSSEKLRALPHRGGHLLNVPYIRKIVKMLML